MSEQGSPHSDTSKGNVEKELGSLRSELKSIGEDIQAKIDQAGDEARETWKKLQQERERFRDKAEQAAEETRSDLRKIGDDLKRRFQMLRDELKSGGKSSESSQQGSQS